jgi:hypothetical protein
MMRYAKCKTCLSNRYKEAALPCSRKVFAHHGGEMEYYCRRTQELVRLTPKINETQVWGCFFF